MCYIICKSCIFSYESMVNNYKLWKNLSFSILDAFGGNFVVTILLRRVMGRQLLNLFTGLCFLGMY